jgi:hypothetical protein
MILLTATQHVLCEVGIEILIIIHTSFRLQSLRLCAFLNPIDKALCGRLCDLVTGTHKSLAFIFRICSITRRIFLG